MERGTVKFFDSRDNKRFGFIRLESGEETFFHFNDGERITSGQSKPEFGGSTWVGKDGKRYQLAAPKQGDGLVFRRADGSKGDKACPWGYAETYDKCVERIANRPAYRVVKETTNTFGQYNHGKDPVVETKVLWEGQDTLAMSGKFPRPSSHRGHDELRYSQIEDGLITFRHWFEKLVDGEWIKCDDPRVLDTDVPRHLLRFGYQPSRY